MKLPIFTGELGCAAIAGSNGMNGLGTNTVALVLGGKQLAMAFFWWLQAGVIYGQNQAASVYIAGKADEGHYVIQAAAGFNSVLQKITKQGTEFWFADWQLSRKRNPADKINTGLLCLFAIVANDKIYGIISTIGLPGV